MSSNNSKAKSIFEGGLYPVFLLISFLIWCFSFKHFLSGKLSLISDASSYYEHFKVYVDHLIKGVYPMWDPSASEGIPLEFYLRRIGSFNPLIFILVIFRLVGIEHMFAYLAFLAIYYFIGMVGYFKLANLVLKDKRIAFVAYLILMFSSLGSRIFDSFIILTFVPMVWFFYFLTAFAQSPKKHQLIGLTLTLMILFTTYIPFYFITVLITFLIFYLLFYFKEALSFFSKTGTFFLRNKLIVVFCLLAFSSSLVPGYLLFKSAKKGEFVLTQRHGSVGEEKTELKADNEMEVDTVWNKWATMEDISYAGYYLPTLKDITFAVVYIPFFAYILFVSGVIVGMSRKLLFLFCWGGLIFLIGSPNVTGLYQFLYDHIFYFKYFRNLHFFLWLVVLPILVLFLAEQMKRFIEFQPSRKVTKSLLFIYVTSIHIAVLIYSLKDGYVLISTYLSWGLSLLFFYLLFIKKDFLHQGVFLAFSLLVITVQPVEVFYYLQKNSKIREYAYMHDEKYLEPRVRSLKENEERLKYPQFFNPLFYDKVDFGGYVTNFHIPDKLKPGANYFDTHWSHYLYKYLNREVFNNYRSHEFYIYDQVEQLGEGEFDLEKVGRHMVQYANLAFVFSDEPDFSSVKSLDAAHGSRHDIVSQESEDVKLLAYGVNKVKLKTNFDKHRFLVYNDSYYDGWQVFINDEKEKLYRTNVAFKGVWVPAGENVVTFKFGHWWQYFINHGLMGLFYILFLMLIFVWVKESKEEKV